MKRVLIAGCGRLGMQLAGRLTGGGCEIYGLRRRAGELGDGISPVAADLTDPDSLQGLPRVDAVVFSATAGEMTEAGYRQTYVNGLENLLAAVERPGARPRLVFVSSTAVYEVDDGSWVDEATPCEPGGFRGRVMLEAESRALVSGGSATVVRFGGIYGPGPGARVDRVRDGRPCRPRHYTNRIHVTDAAGIVHHLLALDEPDSIYLGVDCDPAADCEVMDWLSDRVGVDRPPRERRDRASGKRCRNERIRRSGYRFVYPDFRAGYDAILRGDTG